MIMTFLIVAGIGAAIVLGFILNVYEVQKKEAARESRQLSAAIQSRLYALEAENAKLRMWLASGEMTTQGKTIAAKVMAALDVAHAEAEEARRKSFSQTVVPRNGTSALWAWNEDRSVKAS
jgi:cell shape-determining protein MreC